MRVLIMCRYAVGNKNIKALNNKNKLTHVISWIKIDAL